MKQNNSYNIRIAGPKDSQVIAQFHIRLINKGFLSQLGENNLNDIYRAMLNLPDSFCFILDNNKKPIGFIVATENCNHIYQNFFRKHKLLGIKIGVSRLFHIDILRKLIDHLFYPNRRIVLPPAEILSMAVEKEYGRKGFGGQLFEAAKNEFKKRHVNKFIAIIGKSLVASNSFMTKMRGKKMCEITVHNNEESNVFVWE